MRKPGFSLLRRLGRDRSGASALEFALVAGPFFALLLAIIEVSLVFFGSFTLENAVDQAGRMIRTGQAQSTGMDAGAFKRQVCSKVVVLFDCEAGLKVEVQRFDNFEGINDSLGSPLDDGQLKENYPFNMGNGGDVVVVRAFYEWDIFANLPGVGLSNMPNGSRLLVAATTFRNEPFDN
jgi:Flp pilus assembly protein TadG